MSFLNIKDKFFVISGVANKKSVATFTAQLLLDQGAKPIFTVQHEQNALAVEKLFPGCPLIICDVEKEEDVQQLATKVKAITPQIDGFLHSLAFARFDEQQPEFHQTSRRNYIQANIISCFSLTEMSAQLKALMSNEASVVTVSISDLRATNYGYLGPIKAELEYSVAYLAKSFSKDSKIRFNAVGAGPLKTSASAGIPNYLDNYLYAEQMTMRQQAVKTEEVANTIAFLLSPRSSGINATTITVDAGMSANAFDQQLVAASAKGLYVDK